MNQTFFKFSCLFLMVVALIRSVITIIDGIAPHYDPSGGLLVFVVFANLIIGLTLGIVFFSRDQKRKRKK